MARTAGARTAEVLRRVLVIGARDLKDCMVYEEGIVDEDLVVREEEPDFVLLLPELHPTACIDDSFLSVRLMNLGIDVS